MKPLTKLMTRELSLILVVLICIAMTILTSCGSPQWTMRSGSQPAKNMAESTTTGTCTELKSEKELGVDDRAF